MVLAAAILVGMPMQALADVLVTLQGDRIKGVLANREAILDVGTLPPTVGMLVGEGDDASFLRFARDEVDYVIVTVDGEDRVFDGRTSRKGTSQEIGAGSSASRGNTNPAAGPLLVVAGLGIGALSALNPQGGPKVTVTENDADFDEETYDAINYVGFGLGAALLIAGMAQIQRGQRANRTATSGLGVDSGGRLFYTKSF